MQDDVLGHDAWLKFPFEPEMHRLRHLEQQFTGAQDKPRIGVANAGGELVERARHAGMRVSSKQNLARARVALLRQRRVAHARVT